MEINIDDTISFGKYKGLKVSRIIEWHHPYMEWIRDNTDHSLSQPVLDAIISKNKRTKQALESERISRFHYYNDNREELKNKKRYRSQKNSHDASYGQAFDNNMGCY